MQPLFNINTTITRAEELDFQASGAPVLSKRVVGCYSGLQINKQEMDARPLDRLTLLSTPSPTGPWIG
jgi:hypothetical protein